MKYYSIVSAVFTVLSFFVISSTADAACIGKNPVWGTGDDRSSCAQKQALKKEEQRLKIKRKEAELEQERQDINNGPGAGRGNTNVILGGINEMPGQDNDQVENSQAMPFSRHQARIEFMPYVIPGAYQFDEPGMPKGYSFGVAWEYFLNKNLGIGVVMQQWRKSGGKNFDPIMAHQRDGSGDTAVFFPGAVDEINYTSYLAYASINSRISERWMTILRVGAGITKVDIEYSDTDFNKHPYAHQPKDDTFVDSSSLMIGGAMEYLLETGSRIGAEIRYHNSRYDTDDYMDYINMGSTQLIIYWQFMLTPLGLL